MAETALHAIAVPPASGRPPKAAILLLHGWGANARDLQGLVPALDLPDCFFLCAEAPLDHPQVPGGKMWYDLQVADYPGLDESRQRLRAWLSGVAAQTGVPLDRTILAGFSQGAAMTVDVGIAFPLAGLMCLSGYLHAPVRPPQPTAPPLAVFHGGPRLRSFPWKPLAKFARRSRNFKPTYATPNFPRWDTKLHLSFFQPCANSSKM